MSTYRDDQFQPGDLVTRDDTDVHRVIRTIGDGLIEVVCLRPPRDGWCAVGDVEINLASRYDRAGGLIDGVALAGLPSSAE